MKMSCPCRSDPLAAAQPAGAEGDLRKGKYAGRLPTRTGAIAFPVMVDPGPTATGRAQSTSKPCQPGEPPASPLPVKDQRVPVAADHLRQLYEEIMRRVGDLYPH